MRGEVGRAAKEKPRRPTAMAKPVLLVTRKLPEAIEARAARDYDARLNPQDEMWATDGAQIARRANEAKADGILGAAGDNLRRRLHQRPAGQREDHHHLQRRLRPCGPARGQGARHRRDQHAGGALLRHRRNRLHAAAHGRAPRRRGRAHGARRQVGRLGADAASRRDARRQDASASSAWAASGGNWPTWRAASAWRSTTATSSRCPPTWSRAPPTTPATTPSSAPSTCCPCTSPAARTPASG